MSLPIFKTDSKDLSLLQTGWASMLDPLIGLPQNDSIILKNVALLTGDNSVNHKLGRKLIGWVIIRSRAAATFYDKQDTNRTPALTLTLNASGAVTVDLLVF